MIELQKSLISINHSSKDHEIGGTKLRGSAKCGLGWSGLDDFLIFTRLIEPFGAICIVAVAITPWPASKWRLRAAGSQSSGYIELSRFMSSFKIKSTRRCCWMHATIVLGVRFGVRHSHKLIMLLWQPIT